MGKGGWKGLIIGVKCFCRNVNLFKKGDYGYKLGSFGG